VTECPLFIDPIAAGEGDEVDDNPVPRWFLAAAIVILTIAAYYLGSFLNGPRATSPHRFEHGREVVGGTGHGEATPTATAAPTSPAPTVSGSAVPSPGGSATPSSTVSP
jgi:hypothetical protein